jgi:hypothetical protein
MAGSRGAGEKGQATVEQAALLLLVVAVVLAALLAADALGARSQVGDAVRRQLGRAICLAGGGERCDIDRAPCVVGMDETATEASAGIAVFRLREGGLLSVERRSDGRVTVTVVNDVGGELAVSAHRRLKLLAGRRTLGAGSGPSLDAALAGTIGSGMSWTLRGVPNLRLLPPGVPPPTAVSRRRELSASLHVAFGGGPLRLAADLDARDVVSSGEDRRTRERSIVLSRQAAAALTGRVASRSADGGAKADEQVVLVLDADGQALELVRIETADVRGSRDLPATAQPAAGLLSARGDHRTAVVETHLDLTDAGNLRAAAEALTAARRGAPPWRAATLGAALRDRLDRLGVVHARVYGEDERRYGAELPRGGLPVDLGLSKTFTTSRLLAAATRGADGAWLRRQDCLRTGG